MKHVYSEYQLFQLSAENNWTHNYTSETAARSDKLLQLSFNYTEIALTKIISVDRNHENIQYNKQR